MKNIIKNISFIIVLFLFSTALQAQCENCPSQLVNDTENKLILIFPDAAPSSTNVSVDLFFGENDPKNGIAPIVASNPSTWKLEVISLICCDPLDVIITIGETKCVFKENVFIECLTGGVTGCDEFFSECETELVDFINQYNKYCAKWEGDCNYDNSIRRDAKVGIATSDIPSGYRLAVGKGIVTERARVSLCNTAGWCDYVFEKDYNLMPLSEIKSHIEKDGHLPNIPSAAEIEADGGFEIKEVSLIHQEKIEEAFLHLIELQKKVEELQKEVDKIEKENKNLRKKVTRL